MLDIKDCTKQNKVRLRKLRARDMFKDYAGDLCIVMWIDPNNSGSLQNCFNFKKNMVQLYDKESHITPVKCTLSVYSIGD